MVLLQLFPYILLGRHYFLVVPYLKRQNWITRVSVCLFICHCQLALNLQVTKINEFLTWGLLLAGKSEKQKKFRK